MAKGKAYVALHTADPSGGDQTRFEVDYVGYRRIEIPWPVSSFDDEAHRAEHRARFPREVPMRALYYILDGHAPKPVTDHEKWLWWMESTDRHVAEERIGDVRISTIFCGQIFDVSDTGEPLLFETMIFGGCHDGSIRRCATWTEAGAQHAAAVALVKSGT